MHATLECIRPGAFCLAVFLTHQQLLFILHVAYNPVAVSSCERMQVLLDQVVTIFTGTEVLQSDLQVEFEINSDSSGPRDFKVGARIDFNGPSHATAYINGTITGPYVTAVRHFKPIHDRKEDHFLVVGKHCFSDHGRLAQKPVNFELVA